MSGNGSPEGARTYRASSGTAVLVVAVLFALFLLGDAVLRGGWGQTLLLAPWVLLALWGVYEISFVSHVRTTPETVTVQNLLRRTTFGWARIVDIDLRWQLEFELDDGRKVSCYGGPARSRPKRSRMRDTDAAPQRGADHDLTDIRDQWSAQREALDAPITRSWDGRALFALAVIVIWAVAAVLIANA